MSRDPLHYGIDFGGGDNTPPGAAALKADGAAFVIRYLAEDPRGLNILRPGELADYRANNIEVCVVYESTIGRIRDGYAAGVADGRYAQSLILKHGLAPDMPIYFAVDYDMGVADIPLLYAYMQGAGSAIGPARVGIYGGYTAIDAAAATGCRFLWQTIAWEYGRGLHPQALLYQYAYKHWIGITDTDQNYAYAQNYGQESMFDGSAPVPTPQPAFPEPDLPAFFERVRAQKHPSSFTYKGVRWWPQKLRVKAAARTILRISPSTDAAPAGEDIAKDQLQFVDFAAEVDGHTWGMNGSGYIYAPKFSPQIVVPKRRRSGK